MLLSSKRWYFYSFNNAHVFVTQHINWNHHSSHDSPITKNLICLNELAIHTRGIIGNITWHFPPTLSLTSVPLVFTQHVCVLTDHFYKPFRSLLLCHVKVLYPTEELCLNFWQGKIIFIFSNMSTSVLGPTHSPVKWVMETFSMGVEHLGHDANHSPPSSA